MRIMVESLKRLYESGKISIAKLGDMLRSGTITQQEYDYILGG